MTEGVEAGRRQRRAGPPIQPGAPTRHGHASRPVRPGAHWVGGDVIKVCSMLMVVGIHTLVPQFNGTLVPPLDGGGFRFDVHWWIANLFGSLFRISVPLFFMVSGALLVPRDESILGFLRNRLGRVLLPLAAWSAVYMVWAVNVHHVTVPPLSMLYRQPAYIHLWFLYALLVCYLAIPLLRPILRSGPGPVAYALALWVGMVLWMFVENFQTGGSVSGIQASDYAYYAGYVLLGGAIASYGIRGKPALWIGLLVAGWLSTVLLTYGYSTSIGAPSEKFFGFFAPNVMVGAVAGFFVLNAWAERLGRTGRRVFHELGKVSFGIYLVHILVLSHALGFVASVFSDPTVITVAWFTVNLVVSAGAVFLLSKIPGVRSLI